MAREAEQPLSVIEGPAGPHNAAEWVQRLIDPAHWQMLAAVLGGLVAQIDQGWRHGLPPDAWRIVAEIVGLTPETVALLRAGPPPSVAPAVAAATAATNTVEIDQVEHYIDTLADQISTSGAGVRDRDYGRILLAAQRMVDAHHDHHRRRGESGVPAAPPAPAGPNRAQRRAAKHRR